MAERSPALEAVFRPLERPTTLDEIVKRLGTAIRLGLLAPGSQLPPERDLANRLCIHRSTLKEALATLVQDGHLVALRGRVGGTFVTETPPLSADRSVRPPAGGVRDLLDERVAIEVGATILAAERATAAQLDRLEETVETMEAAATFDDFRRADVRFHIGVAETACSPRLVAAMTEVHGELSDVVAAMTHPTKRLTRTNDQHRSLVGLLRSGDADGASLLMRQHIAKTEHLLDATLG